MPYAPTVQNRSGEIFAAGLTNMAGGIAEAILKHKKNKEESDAASSAAEALMGLFKQHGVAPPDGWEKFTGMSTAAKKGFLGTATIALNSTLQQRERDQHRRSQEIAERIAVGNFNINARRDVREQGQSQGIADAMMRARGSLNAGSIDYNPVPQDQEQGAVTERFMQNLLSNPQTAGSPIAQRIMQERAGQAGGFNFDPTTMIKDIGGGAQFVQTSKGGGQIREPVKPSGTKDRFNIKPVQDFMGRVTGYGVNASFDTEEEAAAFVEKQNKAMGGGGAEASKYKSADDVKAALKAGTLKKDDALKILREQFGYK